MLQIDFALLPEQLRQLRLIVEYPRQRGQLEIKIILELATAGDG